MAHIPLDQLLANLHLLEQTRITNDPGGTLYLAASLIEARDNTDDSSFEYVGEISDLAERHPFGPLVDDLHEAEAGAALEIVVFLGEDDLVADLDVVDAFGDCEDRFFAFFQALRDVRD